MYNVSFSTIGGVASSFYRNSNMHVIVQKKLMLFLMCQSVQHAQFKEKKKNKYMYISYVEEERIRNRKKRKTEIKRVSDKKNVTVW